MPTLFSMLMRHALYFGGARQGVSTDFRRLIVRGLDSEIRRVFETTNVANLGDLTKAEYNRFNANLRAAMQRVFVREGRAFNTTMRELSRIETQLYQAIFRRDTGTRVAIDRSTLWANVRNRPIGATGGIMARAERALSSSSINLIETLARRGFADKLNTADVLSQIRGVQSANFRNGSLARIQAWADSYSSTIFQHVGASSKDYTASDYYDEYDWVSILDNVTTDICIERAGQRYKYGEGPIPPAHYHCRSETVPVNGEAPPPARFVDWLSEQPGEFLSDLFKGGRRDLDSVKVITLPQFAGKLEFILVG